MSIAFRLSPRMTVVLLYTGFASLATVVNLSTQALSLALYDGRFHLHLAMLLGTAAGLVPKYLLDKRWIFHDRSAGLEDNARKFAIYSVLSLATTVIFWSTELAFDQLGHGNGLHYLGAIIGLSIGYWVKYHLDGQLTFTPAPMSPIATSFGVGGLAAAPEFSQ